jgi:hypothetical protein
VAGMNDMVGGGEDVIMWFNCTDSDMIKITRANAEVVQYALAQCMHMHNLSKVHCKACAKYATKPFFTFAKNLCIFVRNQSFAVSNFLDSYLSQFVLRRLLLPIYLILVDFHWA